MTPPLRRHTDVLRETLSWQGRSLLEVGCGDGRLLAWAAREGALPVGLDPGLAQLGRARIAVAGLPLVAGRGEALPFVAGCFDLVLFFNSLHHIPLAAQWQAMAEAARVLGRDGELMVVEPMAEGEHFALLQPVDDETEVRCEAFRAIHAAGALGLRMVIEAFYASRVVEQSWEGVRQRFLAVDPRRAAALAMARSEGERRFATLGEPADGGRAFVQPMRLNLLRRAY